MPWDAYPSCGECKATVDKSRWDLEQRAKAICMVAEIHPNKKSLDDKQKMKNETKQNQQVRHKLSGERLSKVHPARDVD